MHFVCVSLFALYLVAMMINYIVGKRIHSGNMVVALECDSIRLEVVFVMTYNNLQMANDVC